MIANTLLLHLFDKQRANTFFNTLRIVEDDHYQAGLRQELVAYVGQVNGASTFDLSHDLPFYDRYAFKVGAAVALVAQWQYMCSVCMYNVGGGGRRAGVVVSSAVLLGSARLLGNASGTTMCGITLLLWPVTVCACVPQRVCDTTGKRVRCPRCAIR